MIVVQVCVGSSCHLKGAPKIVEMLENIIKTNNLENKIDICGSFCVGKCNRVGVTIIVNDTPYVGITPETFADFWNTRIKPLV